LAALPAPTRICVIVIAALPAGNLLRLLRHACYITYPGADTVRTSITKNEYFKIRIF
jgi:hypothetical protein